MTEAEGRRQKDDSTRAPAKVSVGIASTDPGPTRALLEGFCSALSGACQLKVTAVGVSHYNRLLDAIEHGEVDVAWLPPILALQATARGLVTPIALPLRRGVACYSTALFTRDDGPHHAPSDLSGVKVAWVDRQSAAGYLIIRAHLRAIGVDLAKAFGADLFVGSHDAVARAVLRGDADVGATFAYFDPKSMHHGGPANAVRAGWGSAKVRIVAHAGPIPSDVIAVRTALSADARRSVQRALVFAEHPGLRQAAGALFGAEGFISPLPEHLRPLTMLLRELDTSSESPMPLSSPTRR